MEGEWRGGEGEWRGGEGRGGEEVGWETQKGGGLLGEREEDDHTNAHNRLYITLHYTTLHYTTLHWTIEWE